MPAASIDVETGLCREWNMFRAPQNEMSTPCCAGCAICLYETGCEAGSLFMITVYGMLL